MAEDTSPALGRLLGTGALQKAIDGFGKTVEKLDSVANKMSGGQHTTMTSMGQAMWSGQQGGSGWAGKPNGGVPTSGAYTSGPGRTPPGSAYQATLLGGGNGPQGGGAGNNGGHGGGGVGYGIRATLGSLAAAGANNMADQTTRDYVARYTGQVSRQNLQSAGMSLTGNQRWGGDSADRLSGAYLGYQAAGAVLGSARWSSYRSAVGQMSTINPTFSAVQAYQAQNDYATGQSYAGMRMYGIQTLGAGGQRVGAGQIASQFGQATRIDPNRKFTAAQIGATFDSNISGYNQSLAGAVRSGALTQDQADMQRGYMRNRATAGMNGMSASDFNKYSSLVGNDNAAGKDAQARLLKYGGLDETMLASQKTKVGRSEDIQTNMLGGFSAAVRQANDAIGGFQAALEAVTKGPLGSLLGAGQGGAATIAGGMASTAGGVLAARGIWAAGRTLLGRGVTGPAVRAVLGAGSRILPALGIGVGAGAAAIGAGAAAAVGGVGYEAYKMQSANAHNSEAYNLETQSNPIFKYARETQAKAVGWGEAVAPENGTNPAQGGSSGGSSGGANAASVIGIARKYLGMPYKWGGSNPKTSFDCSGLMQWSFGQAGVKLPRTARQQQQVGKAVAKNRVRPGDLLFMGAPAHHVAMVVGNGQILEAPRTGKNIRVRSYSDGEFTNARRILGSVGSMDSIANSGGGSGAVKQTGQTGGDTGNPSGGGGLGGGLGLGDSEAAVLASILGGGGGGGGAFAAGGAASNSGHTGDDTASAPSTGVSSAPTNPTGNVALGRKMAASRGWTGKQWDALYQLWQGESGWKNTAQNPTSTAYGIAQFLNGTWKGYGKKTSDPATQIKYGMAYVGDRYGDPIHAEAFKKKHNWYDKGAWDIKGDQNAVVHDGEMVVPKADAQTIRAALLRTPQSQVKNGGGGVVLKFEANSVQINVNGSMTSSAAKAAAKQFVDYVAQDNRLTKAMAG